MASSFVDRQGVPVPLGAEIARGGEGTVYGIQGHDKFVAKLYHQPADDEKARKLDAMVASATPGLTELCAWPVEVLREKRSGRTAGIIMPRIDGFRDVHLLYGPRTRLREYPLSGWLFLVRAAANLARAFARVHAHGHVIGDVNDKVALVNEQALVRLVDCDGFQVRGKTELFTCDVGVQTHQPPELQGIETYRGLERTANHDGFGLAVLVFQLLFLARHPFSGTYGGSEDMPLERAIAESRFVYGRGAKRNRMTPPPHSLGLDALTPRLAEAFERAFAKRSSKGGRPSAAAWAKALDELEQSARQCRTNPNHAGLPGRPCPFCKIERKAGTTLFRLPIRYRNKRGRQGTFAIDVAELWKKIRAVDPPHGRPELPRFSPSTEHMLRHPEQAPPGWNEAVRAFRELERAWEHEVSPRAFEARRDELAHAREELAGLDGEHGRRMEALGAAHRRAHLVAYLDAHRVAEADLDDLNAADVAVLESFRIETAADVRRTALEALPGLRRSRVEALLRWRAQVESGFRFDPAQSLDKDQLADLERDIDRRRAWLVQVLVEGPGRLQQAARQAEERLVQLQPELGEAGRRLEALAAQAAPRAS